MRRPCLRFKSKSQRSKLKINQNLNKYFLEIWKFYFHNNAKGSHSQTFTVTAMLSECARIDVATARQNHKNKSIFIL